MGGSLPRQYQNSPESGLISGPVGHGHDSQWPSHVSEVAYDSSQELSLTLDELLDS